MNTLKISGDPLNMNKNLGSCLRALHRLTDHINAQEKLLHRHAAFHYWLKVRSLELYDEIEPEALAVLALIKNEQQ